MKMSSIHPHASITRTGVIAHACLVPGQRGSVLAAFSKALYLLTKHGELFWITTEDAPMHRRCAQLSSTLPGTSAGSLFHVDGHYLMIDNGWSLGVEQVSAWSEPCIDQVVEAATLFSRVHTFFTSLDYSQATGYGTYIPLILSLPQNASTDLPSEPADSILLYARPFVMNMARACLEHQTASISKNTASLVGLGTGLTPSGDDFLGGMFFAMKMLKSNYPGMVLPDYTSLVETFHNRTHLISFTLLNDLADGHAIAPLHQIINGLLCGDSVERIYPFVPQLTRVGHSTGWDLLTGLLVGLLTTYRSHYFIPSFQLTKCMEV